jgi:PQQ-dependent catabolism-associated CXXCW motif protein
MITPRTLCGAVVLSMLQLGPARSAQDSFGAPPDGGRQPAYPSQQQGESPPAPQGSAPYGGNTGSAEPQQPGFYAGPQTAPRGGGVNLDQLMQMERQDFGVAPVKSLHPEPMHGATPASIPGGQVITTKGLVSLVQGGQAPYLLFDVLGGPEKLPNAISAVPAHQAGSFNDRIQKDFGAFLQRVTEGNKETPLVFYCQSSHCWMSYNASLRAINLGYTNVLWYRGGIEAWQMAGLQTQSVQSGFGQ